MIFFLGKNLSLRLIRDSSLFNSTTFDVTWRQQLFRCRTWCNANAVKWFINFVRENCKYLSYCRSAIISSQSIESLKFSTRGLISNGTFNRLFYFYEISLTNTAIIIKIRNNNATRTCRLEDLIFAEPF